MRPADGHDPQAVRSPTGDHPHIRHVTTETTLRYASLAAPGGGDMVHAFEQADGELVIYPDAASFRAAVAADRGRRG